MSSPSEVPSQSGDYLTPSELPKPKLKRTSTGFTPNQIVALDAAIPERARNVWTKFSQLRLTEAQKSKPAEEIKILHSKDGFESAFVNHTEMTLARNMYNCDTLAASMAAAVTIRDGLLVDWANTQQRQTVHDGKRVYYLSLEFLMGRAMDNALINLNCRENTKISLDDLGFNLEDVLDEEPDAGLGNGGLGRLAACYVDSLSSKNYSGWGYGLNYQYGIFKQSIVDGYQVESPDDWLKYSCPWEIDRKEIQIPVDFYGHVYEDTDPNTGKVRKVWTGGERVLAVACDYPIPGFNTENTNNLRLWNAKPTQEFDFAKFNEGDYAQSVVAQQRAEGITAVLYPNDNFEKGKVLRLTQQYFWVAASLHDIVRRFKKNHNSDYSKFPEKIAIQLNDTHPTLAIVELQRILVDLEGMDWDDAWSIVTKTFAYTNHTVMAEALEKWPVDLVGRLLPRHLEIIYDINYYFLQKVQKKFPEDRDLLTSVSCIEEGSQKQVRMAYLAIIGSHKVNGVAELHSELIKTTIFKDFVKVFGPDKFINVTNGITPRRWLRQNNPELAELIAELLNDPNYEYLTNLGQLKKLEPFINNSTVTQKWEKIKKDNKLRLAKLIKDTTNVDVDHRVLFDVQVKRIHEYKRQQMNIFAVIHRYLQIKKLLGQGKSVDDVAKVYIPKVSIFGGKAAPGYYMAKTIIHLICRVGEVVNNDKSIGNLLKVVFIPDYNVSKAEIITAGSDLSNHISTAGTEASGTSNMKFAMSGGLIIGTVDGANVEITRDIGEDNIFLFGNLAEDVDDLRHQNSYGKGVQLPDSLKQVFQEISKGTYGSYDEYRSLVESISVHGDYYLVSNDFESYLGAQQKLEKVFGTEEWYKKSITTVANMGFFSSDRCVDEYAENIWNIEPLSVQK